MEIHSFFFFNINEKVLQIISVGLQLNGKIRFRFIIWNF